MGSLRDSLVPSLSVLISESGLLPCGMKLSIFAVFDSCNSRFVASFKDRIFTAFSSERAARTLVVEFQLVIVFFVKSKFLL